MLFSGLGLDLPNAWRAEFENPTSLILSSTAARRSSRIFAKHAGDQLQRFSSGFAR